MNDRLGLGLLLAVLGSFVAAVLLVLLTNTPGRAVGALLVAGGLAAVTFARALAVSQKELAKKPYIPQHWENVRPMTFVLWGSGVVMLGILLLSGLLQ